MTKTFERYQKRKLISSYFSVVLSISLLLFLLGIFGLLVLHTNKLTDYFKEQITVSIFLKGDTKLEEIKALKKELSLKKYTKKTVFISKKEAAKMYREQIGENFTEFLGYNPLKDAIDIRLKTSYVHNDSLKIIAKNLEKNSYVYEVSYDKLLIKLLNDNIKKVRFGVLVVSIIFAIIAFSLIHSSIRLSVYSKRFIIKTMQMVGATKKFIRRPFIRKSILLGIIGAILAMFGLVFVVYYVDQLFTEINLLGDILSLSFIFIGIFLLGIFISGVSTYFATQRFLNLRTEDLYY